MSNESDYFIKALVSVTSEIDSVNEWSVIGASVWRCVVNGLVSRKNSAMMVIVCGSIPRSMSSKTVYRPMMPALKLASSYKENIWK